MAAIAEENKVTHPYLGKSGLKVSNLALGTMTFGKGFLPGNCDEELSHQLLDRYVEWGGNFIDTADVYSTGESERIIGTWLQKQPSREKFVIATKCFFGFEKKNNVNAEGLNRRHIIASVDKSLARLQTDYIDLYQPHIWDSGTPLEETLRTLDDLVRCGKIRYVGYSNLQGWQLQKVVDLSEKLGLNPIVSLQQQYNLAARESEFEPFQVCKSEGLGVLAWSGLKGGLFSGKIKRDQLPQEGRLGWVVNDKNSRVTPATPHYKDFSEQTFVMLDKVEEIAKKLDRTVPQVALRWILQRDVVTSVIVGARTLAQLDDNMAAANGWKLSEEEMAELDAVSAPSNQYPYVMVGEWYKNRKNPTVVDEVVRSTY